MALPYHIHCQLLSEVWLLRMPRALTHTICMVWLSRLCWERSIPLRASSASCKLCDSPVGSWLEISCTFNCQHVQHKSASVLKFSAHIWHKWMTVPIFWHKLMIAIHHMVCRWSLYWCRMIDMHCINILAQWIWQCIQYNQGCRQQGAVGANAPARLRGPPEGLLPRWSCHEEFSWDTY